MGRYPNESGHRHLTPSDAGIWISGHHGWHAHHFMIEYAVDLGYPITEDDRKIVDTYRAGQDNGNDCDRLFEIMDEAEQWLNENVVPEGYSFGWSDGEWFLASEEWWDE